LIEFIYSFIIFFYYQSKIRKNNLNFSPSQRRARLASILLISSFLLLKLFYRRSFWILAWKETDIGKLAWFSLIYISTIELLVEHILMGFQNLEVKHGLNLNVNFGVEGVFCSPWQLNLRILSFLNFACNQDFLF
jgi:hypothetical protein